MSYAIFLGRGFTKSHLLFICNSDLTGHPVFCLAALLFLSAMHLLLSAPAVIFFVGHSWVRIWGFLIL